jgi:hypothetical protein
MPFWAKYLQPFQNHERDFVKCITDQMRFCKMYHTSNVALPSKWKLQQNCSSDHCNYTCTTYSLCPHWPTAILPRQSKKKKLKPVTTKPPSASTKWITKIAGPTSAHPCLEQIRLKLIMAHDFCFSHSMLKCYDNVYNDYGPDGCSLHSTSFIRIYIWTATAEGLILCPLLPQQTFLGNHGVRGIHTEWFNMPT